MFFVFLTQIIKSMIKSYKRKIIKRQPRERQYNFLKYWRVVKYYIKRKYNISDVEC